MLMPSLPPPRPDDLSAFPALLTFDAHERDALLSAMEARTYRAGEVLFHEDDPGRDLMLVREGEIVFSKRAGKREVEINRVAGPALFGEMAFLAGVPRTAKATAATDVRVLLLAPEALPEGTPLRYKLEAVLGRTSIRWLQAATDRHIDEMDVRRRFGILTVLVMVVLSMMTAITGMRTAGELDLSFPIYYAAPLIMISMIWIAVAAVKAVNLPRETLGFTFKGSGRALAEGAVVCAVMALIYRLQPYGEPFLDVLARMWSSPAGLVYISVAVLQELFCRGILQTAFQRFYDDRKGWLSVALTSLVYAISHAYIGVGIVIASFVFGVILGFLYLRHRNLLGVILVHYWAGAMALALGLLK